MTVDSISSDCDPIVTMGDLGLTQSFNKKPLSASAPANPCGLVAKSFFNDTFNIYNGTNKTSSLVSMNENGIAWDSDKEYKFKNMDGDWESY